MSEKKSEFDVNLEGAAKIPEGSELQMPGDPVRPVQKKSGSFLADMTCWDGTTGSRRGFLRACCVASFGLAASGGMAAALAACGGSSTSGGGSGMQLRVGHLPAGCVSHLLLANKNGWFADAGLNVKLTQFNGPGDNLQALLAGTQDLVHNPWTNSIVAFDQGTDDLRIVCGSGKNGIELVAREGSVTNLQQFADAADTGLRVGTLKLDTLELVTYGLMQELGVDYSQYKMKFFPSMVGMGDALIQENMDVVSLAQPYAQTVVDDAGGTYLGSSAESWGPDASDCVVSGRDGFLKKEPNLVKDYLSVLETSAGRLSANYDRYVRELVPVYGSTDKILKVALKRQSPQPTLAGNGIASIKRGAKYLVDLGYFESEKVADQVYDPSYQPS
jgi:NitT/TauT family transport system substrate-binding protein